MNLAIYHVNAFTTSPFAGNPAAICLLDEAKPDEWLQNVAAQMNLSETAFVLPLQSGYSLRWFTPAKEVELCGHATLACAHTLRELALVSATDTLVFHTLSGQLEASFVGQKISLNFPATPTQACERPSALIEALRVNPLHWEKFGEKYLLELATTQELRDAKPDFNALMKLKERGVTLTCADHSGEYDFISRYFAPWVGINEDPVNGSSHCALAPFWGEKLSKTKLNAYQASARGGALALSIEGERIAISGYAKTVLKGELIN